MHATVSRADPYSLSYMLIFTKEFLCALDCHQCSREHNHIKSCVESARWPTTNYCRRDYWDFSLVPWRTRMTLNCCIYFANVAAAAATAIAAQARSILFVHRLVHFMHGENDTNTEFHLWLEFQITTNQHTIFCHLFGILFLEIVKQFIEAFTGQWILVFYFRFIVLVVSVQFFSIESFDWNCEARPLFNLWCIFHICS